MPGNRTQSAALLRPQNLSPSLSVTYRNSFTTTYNHGNIFYEVRSPARRSRSPFQCCLSRPFPSPMQCPFVIACSFQQLTNSFFRNSFLFKFIQIVPGGAGPKAKPRRNSTRFRSDVPTFRRSSALTSLESYCCAMVRAKCNGIIFLCKNIGGWGSRSESRPQTSPDSVKLDFPGGAAYFLRQAQHSQ